MNAKKIISKHMTTFINLQSQMPDEVYLEMYQLLQDSWHDMIKLGMYHRDNLSENLWKSIKKEMDKYDDYDRSQDMGD